MIVVVGAGCAGLSCARVLADAGQPVVVVDKSKGLGGRAATRRLADWDDQPVDHGLGFYHGSDESFLAALGRVESDGRLEGWPTLISGNGLPPVPRAFSSQEHRVAFEEGVTAFPKALAVGLDVRRSAALRSVRLERSGFELEFDGATGPATLSADGLVLAMPLEQARARVSQLPESSELGEASALLASGRTEPCLTLIAAYPLSVRMPSWQMYYPEASEVLSLVSHDSTKRPHKTIHVLVFQCNQEFSRRHLDLDPARWSQSILREGASLFGSWVTEPTLSSTHRWRFARSDGPWLGEPPLVHFASGRILGLAGEHFHPASGIEGAFLSGRLLAERMLNERSG